jgi:predicted cobalt transporter CbtA
MRSRGERVAIGIGVAILLIGLVATTSASGFFDSLIFWGLVGLLVAAFIAGRVERRAGR